MSAKGYVKLFQKILDSTIWMEDDQTRIVWITLLAMSDEDGMVDAPLPAIAARARVDTEICRKAMELFQQPDTDSRTPDFDGRRIEKKEGGWLLLNHAKYRSLMSLEQRREYKRLKAQEYRDRDAQKGNGSGSTSVTKSAFSKPSVEEMKAHGETIGLPEDQCEKCWNYYESKGWKVGAKSPMVSWRASMSNWKKTWQERTQPREQTSEEYFAEQEKQSCL